jgi:uncharacterized membrane protein YfcA
MDFLSNLHTDVKLLLVAGALALLAALLSGSQRNEHRYMALFTVLMLAAGYRFYAHSSEDEAQQAARAAPVPIQQSRSASGARHKTAQ